MAKLIFLGTSSAVAEKGRENTHFILLGDQSQILVDCGGNPVRRMGEAGVDFRRLTDVILTHFHPDHVSGLPLLLMDMWILGGVEALNLYGSQHTLQRVQAMMDLFDMGDWPDMYPLHYHYLPLQNNVQVLENDDFSMQSAPADHTIPALAYRVEHRPSGFVIVFSGDSNPSPATISLAEGADVLIHEASGDVPGHSSPGQAGKIAAQAGVKQLYLVHYSLHNQSREAVVNSARKFFPGPVAAADDLLEIEFGGE